MAPRSGTATATTSAAPPPQSSAANDFGPERGQVRATPVNVVVTSVLPPKMAVVTRDRVAVDGDVDVVGQHRAVELDREPADDVAALVGHGEHDEVGGLAAVDDGLIAAATAGPGSAPARSPVA